MKDFIFQFIDRIIAAISIPAFLAIATTVGFFGAFMVLAFARIQSTDHDILLAMVSSLGTAWVGVMGYYFGSSSGSAAKTKIIADQTQTSSEAK